MDYKGIKIYDKVIIVERTSTTEGYYNYKGRTVNQGYVVDINNKKMLDTALSWAKWTKYPKDEDFFGEGKRYWSDGVTPEQRRAYDAAKEEIPGVVYEYENGKFQITLDEAAGMSSQGGKLSFWNCIIKAPDGKEFLIGINSELLLHLMMETTFNKGVCTDNLWLGRIKGTQVGVFTEDMEDFKQAKIDEECRNVKKTKTYVPGDIVETLTTRELYIGEFYVYAQRVYEKRYYWNYDYKQYIKMFDKPKKVYGYVSLYTSKDKEKEITFDGSSSIEFKETKTPRLVVGHTDKVKNEYIKLVNDFKSEYKKLRVKDRTCSDDKSPFSYFNEDIVIRTNDKASVKEVQADLEETIKYEKENNPNRKGEMIVLDASVFDNEKFEERESYCSYWYFRNYMQYYKE